MLELRDVVKTYVSGDERVRAVDGDLARRRAAASSSRSTARAARARRRCCCVAAGMLRPDSGAGARSTVATSRRLSDREAARYRLRDVGFVFQSFHLIAGLPAIDNAAVKLLGRGVRATRRAPTAHDAMAGARRDRRAGAAPAGQSSRRASASASPIARALANEPRLCSPTSRPATSTAHSGRAVLALLARDLPRAQGLGVLLVDPRPGSASTSPTACSRCATASSPTHVPDAPSVAADGIGRVMRPAQPSSSSTGGGCARSRCRSCSRASGIAARRRAAVRRAGRELEHQRLGRAARARHHRPVHAPGRRTRRARLRRSARRTGRARSMACGPPRRCLSSALGSAVRAGARTSTSSASRTRSSNVGGPLVNGFGGRFGLRLAPTRCCCPSRSPSDSGLAADSFVTLATRQPVALRVPVSAMLDRSQIGTAIGSPLAVAPLRTCRSSPACRARHARLRRRRAR